MADKYGQYLRYYLAEVTHSTLATEQIPTGCGLRIGGGTGIAMEVRAIMCSLSQPEDLPSTGATEYVAAAISVNEDLTTMPNLQDKGTIYKTYKGTQAGVGTYLPLIDVSTDMPPFTQFDIPVLVSHPSLNAYVQSSNSAAEATMKGFIFHNYVDVDGSLAIEALEVFR